MGGYTPTLYRLLSFILRTVPWLYTTVPGTGSAHSRIKTLYAAAAGQRSISCLRKRKKNRNPYAVRISIFSDANETRTRVTTVKGWCLNRLTIAPYYLLNEQSIRTALRFVLMSCGLLDAARPHKSPQNHASVILCILIRFSFS